LDETLADDFRSIPINRHSPDPSAGGLELASDPLVPWYAKALGLAVAAYALSPIDLIPDFGIALVVRLMPPEVMEKHRALASAAKERPVSFVGGAVIVLIWIAAIELAGWLVSDAGAPLQQVLFAPIAPSPQRIYEERNALL
jgi:hypothetical protein